MSRPFLSLSSTPAGCSVPRTGTCWRSLVPIPREVKTARSGRQHPARPRGDHSGLLPWPGSAGVSSPHCCLTALRPRLPQLLLAFPQAQSPFEPHAPRRLCVCAPFLVPFPYLAHLAHLRLFLATREGRAFAFCPVHSSASTQQPSLVRQVEAGVLLAIQILPSICGWQPSQAHFGLPPMQSLGQFSF